ncbi:hypothetical protein NEPAR04_2216 [Nematocida parisii]|nr:hypothetical protein NEPAR04_2216 [Nematocida parisii]KAI5193049.1 hypothetical protein NECID01_2165 [Nematocida sp. AWRm77]
MGRITSLMLLGIFVALSSVHSTQVSANFILEDGTAVSDTVPRGAFATLENQGKYSKNIQKLLHASEAQENAGCVTMFLPGFPDKEAYARFKSLWSTDSAPDTEEREESSAVPSCLMRVTAAYARFKSWWNNAAPLHFMNITAKEFQDFMFAANYLDLQGEYAERFAENMVKYGLLGAHSADIVSSMAFSNYDLPYDIFRGFLYAFLRQTGFAYRLTHPSAGQTMLRIEKADAWAKQIDDEYTGPSQTSSMRTVLHSKLAPVESPEKERNEAVLGWLLLNIGGSSVDIQYTIEVFSDNTTELSQPIKQFTKENEKGARVRVEGLALNIYRRNSFFLRPALQLVPGLSRLGLFNTASSLISPLSLCPSLKTLKIAGKPLESAEVSRLAESLPSIKHMSLWCKPLKETAIDSLKKCTRLEKLNIREWPQPSAVVQAILTHLPLLKELSIECEPLTPAAAEAFQACTKLEILKMWGEKQPSATVQALLIHLPLLKELSIGCNVLEPAAAEACQACTKLEILKMWGEEQPSTAVQAIATRLPSLKHLRIETGSADFSLADALRNCSSLHFLHLSALQYTPDFLARYLQSPCPRLKSLTLHNHDTNNNHSEEDNRAVEEAQKMGMSIWAF